MRASNLSTAAMRTVLFFAFTLFSLSAIAAPNDWSGSWDTRWRDGAARLELHQTGARVEGTYAAYAGVVEGTISGKVLKGRWRQGPKSGGFDFVMASDGKSFVGRYETGEWWTGARLTPKLAASETVDLSTPRATMRTFLDAGNTARMDAPDEMSRALAAVDFGGVDLPPEVKLAHTKALFDLVDQTTFRLFEIPESATADRLSIVLHQAGTDAEMPVQFSKTGAKWSLDMPDDAHLAALGKALYARSGGRVPPVEEYEARGNARNAYRAFTRSFYDWDTGGQAKALAALDLSAVPMAVRDYEGTLAAQYLNGVLNRVGLLEPQEIPDDPKNLQPYVLFSHPAGQIVIGPSGKGGTGSWKFTQETVRNARALFVVIEDLPPVAGPTLPSPSSLFFDVRSRIRAFAPALLTQFGPLEAWQVIGWGAVFLVSMGLGLLLTEVVMRMTLRVLGTRDAVADRRSFRFAVWGAIGFSVYKLLIPVVGLSETAKQLSVGATGVLLVLSLMWLGWITIDALGNRFFGSRDGKHVTMDNIVVSLFFGFLKLGLMIAGFTLIAIELSLPYEGIIASLSIGGLAVAFASRETLSNVFGAGVLAIDRPFRRGDSILAGGVDGTVEHVGIRSTRVRTNDDSLVIIPNGKLADAFVNNLGSRRYHLGILKLPLPFSTGVSQLEALMQGVREIVDAVPEIVPQRTCVALSSIGADGLQLAVSYSIDASRGGDETSIVNRILLDVLALCDRLGVRASQGNLVEAA